MANLIPIGTDMEACYRISIIDKDHIIFLLKGSHAVFLFLFYAPDFNFFSKVSHINSSTTFHDLRRPRDAF